VSMLPRFAVRWVPAGVHYESAGAGKAQEPAASKRKGTATAVRGNPRAAPGCNRGPLQRPDS
jgi:hypothetical protein